MIKRIIRFLEGEYKSENQLKEEYLVLGIASVHLVYLIIFLIFQIDVMVVVNIFSLLAYIFCILSARKRNYRFLFVMLTCEVIIHMIAAIICLGWSYGFELYFMLLVPAMYYIQYCAAMLRQKIIKAWIGAFFCVGIFVVLKLYTFGHEPIYHIGHVGEMVFGMLNGLLGFGMLLFLMSTFIGAIRQSERILRDKNRKLRDMANIDPLTKLLNRRGFEKCILASIDDAKQQGSTFCLVMCDIDDFKIINDTYGHACGDFILQRVAETLRENTRSNDYICRWGGEEMLILLNGCNSIMGTRAIEKIRKIIEEIVMDYNNNQIRFTLTFGIQEYETGMTFESMTLGADEKMYRGKRSGKNKIVS